MRVAVLCGGSSYERAVSLRSGAAMEHALRELGHDVVMLDTGPDTSAELAAGSFDIAAIALHGVGGEDGSIQSLLELMDIPYTGSRPGPCQLAHDKVRAKRSLVSHGIATPASVSLTSVALSEFGAADALAEAGHQLGFPLVVKPAQGGSSLGVRVARDAGELPRALISALSWDTHVLVERFISGRELSVCMLGTESPRCLPPVRITPRHADHFDFEARSTTGDCTLTSPPTDLDADEIDRACAAALATYEALDLSGWARADMIIDADGAVWMLECNSVPGVTSSSLLPIAAAAAGLSLADVLSELLADALVQHSGDVQGA